MTVVHVLLDIVLALAFLAAGGAKITRQSAMVGAAQHLGFTVNSYVVIGSLEVAGAVGLLVGLALTPLGVVAAIALALLMAGGVVTHLRVGDGPSQFAPAAVLGVLAVVTAVTA